jgi:hypothetical protein
LIKAQFEYIADLVTKNTEKLTNETSFLEKIYKKTEKTSCCGCSIRTLSSEYKKFKISELEGKDLINLSGHEFILSFFVGLSQLGLLKDIKPLEFNKYLEEKCFLSLQDNDSVFYTLENNLILAEKLLTAALTIHSSFNKSETGYVLAMDILKHILDRLDISLPNFISVEYISKLTSKFKLQIVLPQLEKSILGQKGDDGVSGSDGKNTGAYGYYIIANDLNLDINKGKDGVPGKGGIGGAGGKNGQNGFVEYCLVAPYTTEEKDYKLDQNSECAVLYSIKAKNDDLYKEKFGVVENSKNGFPGDFGDITQNPFCINNMQRIAEEFYCSGKKDFENDYYNLFHLEKDYLTALIGEEYDLI